MSATLRPLAATLALIALLVSLPRAQVLPTDAPWEGFVFVDANRNGTRDEGERGVPGVAVSNQHRVARTDASGMYQILGGGTGVVFVSVPGGFEIVGSFWRDATPGAWNSDFALAPRSGGDETFTFLHASDPHVDAASLPRLARVRAIVEARRPAFVLMTGDLVRDALRVGEEEASGYYALYQAEIGKFPVPVWSVPGNHENFGIERHLSKVSTSHPLYGKGMYRARLGPNYYSFTYGGVHFVGLDTVDIADRWYYGHVDDAQLAWLTADLAAIPAALSVVTFNHIPLVSAVEMVKGYTTEGAAPTTLEVGGRTLFRHVVSNYADVQRVLPAARWPLALGGHIHLRELIRYGSPVATRFEQAAAIVGGGSGTIPAISGVTIYTVRKGVIDAGAFVPLD